MQQKGYWGIVSVNLSTQGQILMNHNSLKGVSSVHFI